MREAGSARAPQATKASGRSQVSARAEESRREILKAALRVLASGGAKAVTHRAVAREAGVSPALTTYHFESRMDLLNEAYRMLSQTESRRYRASLAALGEVRSEDFVDTAFDYLMSEIHELRVPTMARLELLLAAARQPELQPLVDGWYEGLFELMRELMRKLGSPEPEIDADILTDEMTAIVLHGLAQGGQVDEARLRRRLSRLHDNLFVSERAPRDGGRSGRRSTK